MIVSLLMTVEKSQPLISRLVNVEDSMHLGELSQVIDAAFGFSGAESHLYMGPAAAGTQREVLTAAPGPGERPENEATVAQMREITYVYDPNADWNIHVEVLGSSRLDGPTPLLIDALGPDVVEACNGPAMMSRFHAEARRITAGLDPDMDVAPLLLSFLPVMSPERLLQRLTQADQVTVSERISFIAEDLFLGTAGDLAEDPRTPQFAADFEDFLDARPDLREILSLDPAPERNPTLIAAMAEFFEDALGDGEGAEPGSGEDAVGRALGEVIRGVWFQPGHRVKLTSTGAFPPGVAGAIAGALGFPPASPRAREKSLQPLPVIRRVLTAAGLLRVEDGWISATREGVKLADWPGAVGELNEVLRAGFEEVLGPGRWGVIISWAAGKYGLVPAGPQEVPQDLASVYALMTALNILAEQPGLGMCLTPGGAEFIGRMLDAYDEV